MVLLAHDGVPSGLECQCAQSDDGSRLCSTATGASAPWCPTAWPSRGSQRRSRLLHLRHGWFCSSAAASAAPSGASVRKQTTGAARAPRTLALLPHGTSPQGPPLARSVELKEQHRQSTQHARGELEELKKRHQHSAEAALGQSARALVAEFAGGQEKGAEGLTNLKEQHRQSTQHARGELEELKKRHQHSAEAALGLSARALVAEFARGRKKGAEGLTELKEQHRQSTQHVRGKVEELKKRHQHSAEASLK